MSEKQKNYQVMEMGTFAGLGEKGRMEIGDTLGLTGCEVSMNSLPAGKGIPFIHFHKTNEEVYIIVSGGGIFYVDGEEFAVQEGSLLRVAPAGERGLKAGDNGMVYICIQAQAGSLTQKTSVDGSLTEAKASWMS